MALPLARYRTMERGKSPTSSSSGVTTSATGSIPSCYHSRHDGLQDAQHRPHRQRRRALSTDWYGGHRAAPPDAAAFVTGQARIPHGSSLKVGLPGAPEGHASTTTPPIAGLTQSAGLHDRPVWQEPPGRPRRACCPPPTASTSSMGSTSITSMPRKSRKTRTTRRSPALQKQYGHSRRDPHDR